MVLIETEKDFLNRQIKMDRQLIELQDRRIHALQAELDKKNLELEDCYKNMRKQWQELDVLRKEKEYNEAKKRVRFKWF